MITNKQINKNPTLLSNPVISYKTISSTYTVSFYEKNLSKGNIYKALLLAFLIYTNIKPQNKMINGIILLLNSAALSYTNPKPFELTMQYNATDTIACSAFIYVLKLKLMNSIQFFMLLHLMPKLSVLALLINPGLPKYSQQFIELQAKNDFQTFLDKVTQLENNLGPLKNIYEKFKPLIALPPFLWAFETQTQINQSLNNHYYDELRMQYLFSGADIVAPLLYTSKLLAKKITVYMEDKLDPEKLNREFRNLTSNVEKNQKEIIDYRWRIAFRTAQSETEENFAKHLFWQLKKLNLDVDFTSNTLSFKFMDKTYEFKFQQKKITYNNTVIDDNEIDVQICLIKGGLGFDPSKLKVNTKKNTPIIITSNSKSQTERNLSETSHTLKRKYKTENGETVLEFKRSFQQIPPVGYIHFYDLEQGTESTIGFKKLRPDCIAIGKQEITHTGGDQIRVSAKIEKSEPIQWNNSELQLMPESKKQEYIKKLLSAPQSSKRTLEMIQGHLCDNTLMRLFMKNFLYDTYFTYLRLATRKTVNNHQEPKPKDN